MSTGTVKWFNPTKGFGFIVPDGGGQDIFVHISAVTNSNLVAIKEGDRIGFDLSPDRQGRSTATNLTKAA